jgi:metacaspase-1
MAAPLRILCVHGVGDHHTNLSWEDDWKGAVRDAVGTWNQDLELDFQFLLYDEIFEKYPVDGATYAKALFELSRSGVEVGVANAVAGVEHAAVSAWSGITGFFHPSRGLADIPDELRWTAGMVAQWADNADLRAETRDALTRAMNDYQPGLILAHSLGTLISYDTFSRDQGMLTGKSLFVFGSQIGNPFVRGVFGGRITALTAADGWYQLYNPNDRAFSAPIQVTADNFHRALCDFHDGFLSHDAVQYLSHPNAVSGPWRDVATPRDFAPIARSFKAYRAAARPPKKRALLVGINDYPDPANRLDGCLNDVFRISAALQETDFDPEDIRVVFDDRATAAAINERLHWLLDGVCPGDERVFFYSGHGTQMPSYGVGGKIDRVMASLVPYDFDWTPAHALTDDQFLDFYSQLPFESSFVSIFDCCHSGGMVRAGGAKVRGITPPDDVRHRALKWEQDLEMWVARDFKPPEKRFAPLAADRGRDPSKANRPEVTHPLGSGMTLRQAPPQQQKRAREAAGHKGPYMPLVIEACKEDQLSYEYRDGVESFGAFTFVLTKVLRDARRAKRPIKFDKLVQEAGDRLRILGFEQQPSLRGPSAVISQPIPWHRRR